jgi:aspartyl/glutamyl-tRNA(Asn/Gln) amidotransferase C subunit
MPDRLTAAEVRHIARLARLRLSDEDVERFRDDVSAVLNYAQKLEELDLDEVEPMSHPLDVSNRLDEDVEGPVLPREILLGLTPAVEGPFIAAPRVLGEGA